MPITSSHPTKTTSLDATEIAIAAIYAVLNFNGSWGWEDWSKLAAAGEWA